MQQLDTALAPRTVFDQLAPDVQQLVVANATLYNGQCDDLAEDVRRRQAGRPYLFKLDFEIDDILGWIGRLKNYETVRGEAFANALRDAV